MTPCEKCEKREDWYEACSACKEDFDIMCDHKALVKDMRWENRHDMHSQEWAHVAASLAERKFHNVGYIQRFPLCDEPAEPSFYRDPVNLLRMCFGFDAHFVVVEKGEEADAKCPEHKNHEWWEGGLQTTICLLKLSKPSTRTMATRSMKGIPKVEQAIS